MFFLPSRLRVSRQRGGGARAMRLASGRLMVRRGQMAILRGPRWMRRPRAQAQRSAGDVEGGSDKNAGLDSRAA